MNNFLCQIVYTVLCWINNMLGIIIMYTREIHGIFHVGTWASNIMSCNLNIDMLVLHFVVLFFIRTRLSVFFFGKSAGIFTLNTDAGISSWNVRFLKLLLCPIEQTESIIRRLKGSWNVKFYRIFKCLTFRFLVYLNSWFWNWFWNSNTFLADHKKMQNSI